MLWLTRGKLKSWQPPTLPGSPPPSTIGRLWLNRRVRNGNGCDPQTHRHQLTPRVGLEPTTLRLTAGCSTIELSRKTVQPKAELYKNHFVILEVIAFNLNPEPSKLHIKLRDPLIFLRVSFSLLLSSFAAVEQAPRPISTGQLNISLCLHLRPIALSSSRGLTPLGWDISS